MEDSNTETNAKDAGSQSTTERTSIEMNYRTLGKTGCRCQKWDMVRGELERATGLPPLTMSRSKALNKGLDLGLNFVDTALGYG